MFDLEANIVRWRQSLSASAMQSADVEELESHLRESFDRLYTLGLPREECFLLAARRLGNPTELGLEYAKEHPAGIWRDRLLWMLYGVLALHVLSGFARLVGGAGSISSMAVGIHGVALTICTLATTLSSYAIAITAAFLAWRTLRERHEFATRWMFSACLIFVILQPILTRVVYGHLLVRFAISQDYYQHYILPDAYLQLALNFMFPVLLGVTIWRLRRENAALN